MNPVQLSSNTDILNIKTVQILPIRVLMTALKDIILETNIEFTPEGIKIINMDKSHTVLAYVNLLAPNFEYFQCNKERIVIGVNMVHLHKLITSMDSGDTLTISIDRNDYNDGIVSHLTLKFENNQIKQCVTKKLRTIEPEAEDLEYPSIKFSSIVNLPSTDFQRIVKDCASLSNKLEIESVGNQLNFRCCGNYANSEISRDEIDGGLEFQEKQENNKIVHGVFSSRQLMSFIKCTPLCDQIEIYLEDDLPLVIKYDVASLGIIKLCLSPLPPSS